MILSKNQNVKTALKVSKCQNVILSKYLKSLAGYGLSLKCQKITAFSFDVLIFYPLSRTQAASHASRQNITQAHYYVMGANLSFAPIRVTGFPHGKIGQQPLFKQSTLTGKEKTMRTKTADDFSHENPVTINPRDDYYTSNRVRLMLGRYGTTRSEMAATIGPIFDCMEAISDAKLREIMQYLSMRASIDLS